jgi:hypothetical protein
MGRSGRLGLIVGEARTKVLRDHGEMGRGGYRDRKERLTNRKPGQWASSSQDFLFVVSKVYALSAREAKKSSNGNWSGYAYAGIPLLLSSIHAFIVEYENMLRPNSGLQRIDALDAVLEQRYGVSGSLLEDVKNLIEIRNEVTHPVHLPAGTSDNWPGYLRRIKTLGVLNSTGRSEGDYDLLGQIASHRLFRWAMAVARRVFYAIIESDPERAPQFHDLLSNLDAPWFPKSDSDDELSVLLSLV